MIIYLFSNIHSCAVCVAWWYNAPLWVRCFSIWLSPSMEALMWYNNSLIVIATSFVANGTYYMDNNSFVVFIKWLHEWLFLCSSNLHSCDVCTTRWYPVFFWCLPVCCLLVLLRSDIFGLIFTTLLVQGIFTSLLMLLVAFLMFSLVICCFQPDLSPS